MTNEYVALSNSMRGTVGPATPSEFAVTCSRGQWQRARHLDVIEQACLTAIDTGSGVILSVAVRHGKSEYASHWLPSWFLGKYPDRRIIMATHSARFARTWGRKVRDTLAEYGPAKFDVRPAKGNLAAHEWSVEDHSGGMLAVGVGGSPVGRGADLLIVDDPFANWRDGTSPLRQQQVQDWWTGTMESRREPGAAAIVICARWHENDLSGFLLESAPDDWTEVRLPAVCDDPATDPLSRELGDPLWPERYDAADLQKAKTATSLSLGPLVWDAQYQQTPTNQEGGMFTADWATMPRRDIEHISIGVWVRRWDLAATAQGGDWTVGVLATKLLDGRTALVDTVAGQWAPDDVRTQIRACAESDPEGTRTIIPQDPGQAGKDQAQQLIRMLAPYSASSELESGAKEVRAAGLAAQQRSSNVVLGEAAWNRAFIAELVAFPRGRHDDQVDAAAGAFNALHGAAGPAESGNYRIRPRAR